MIMDQLLARTEHLHANGVVHYDVKPRDFLMGALWYPKPCS